jgi:nucleoside-diphosphate-sugar epimerase
MGDHFEQVTMEVNHEACIRVAKKAKAMGVKSFVFASSCSIYGAASPRPKTETSNVNPLTAYAKSKVYSERDLRPLADDKFAVTCLRFGTACGMGSRLRLDLVLNDFVACALATRKITILSDGTPWRPLIHIKDMAAAIEWAVSRAVAGPFLAINAGSESWNFRVKELADAVAHVVPDVAVSVSSSAPPDRRSYLVDFGLYKVLAPFHQPHRDLIGTIRELKEGLEAMNFNDANFRNSRFMRLKALTELQEKDYLTDQLTWASPEQQLAVVR